MSVLSLTFPRFDFTINELDIAGVPVLLLALCKHEAPLGTILNDFIQSTQHIRMCEASTIAL